MQAAATVGIEIPRLCYLKGINEISACKVCVVEIQGQNRVVTACTTPVQEGLVVYTNSPKARSIRRTNVELILSQHDCMCATCVRSGNCSLQTWPMTLAFTIFPMSVMLSTLPGTRSSRSSAIPKKMHQMHALRPDL